MPLAATSPFSAAAPTEGTAEERDNALLREEAVRMATSFIRFAEVRRRALDATALVVVDHVATDEAAYQLRGKLLAPAPNAPVVLVAIKREPDSYPSYRELRAAFGLTRSEARVATKLAERKTNSEIARELGVTGATARRHTERILLKMGVGRRAAVRHALMECAGGWGSGCARGIHSAEHVGADDHPGESARSRSAHATAHAFSGANEAREPESEPRRGRPKQRIVRRQEPKESVVVLLDHEHQRRVVRDALAGEVEVRFADGPREVHPPWRHEVPLAVLVELHEEREHRMERALGILRREAPDIPRWAYAELEPRSVDVVVRLVALGLVAEVITTAEDLGSRLRALLKNARVRSEGEALRRVWHEWVGPDARVIVEACIDASAGAATPRDVERQFDKTIRSLNRELSSHGLPPLAHIVAFCRMLRAMYRLDHRDIKVKAVASELGYRYSYALSHQLHWFTGLSITSLPAGRRFATLAALVRAELSATRRRVTDRGLPRASEEGISTTDASTPPGGRPPKPPGSI